MTKNEKIINILLSFKDEKGQPFFNRDWVLARYGK